MSIAEKLLTIAKNEQKVYDAGFEAGKSSGGYGEAYEAGQKAEYDRFWESFQLGGTRTAYSHGFAGQCWSDETYNPKYEIIVTGAGSNMYAWNGRITSTKVPIIIDTTNSSGLFSYTTSLKTIPSIKVTERATYTSWFTGCGNLENITFTNDSIIANNINLSPCTKLMKDSLLNIISVLKDFRTTQSYDCSFKTWQEENMNNIEYDKFYEIYASHDDMGVVQIFVNPETAMGIVFDEELPTEIAQATHIAFDESGESIALKFATTTATKTLTLGATNLEKLTDLEKAEATQKGWTLA